MGTRIAVALSFWMLVGGGAVRGEPWMSLWDTGKGSGADRPQAVALDGAGNILVAGTNSETALTAKYAPGGELVWKRTHESLQGLSRTRLVVGKDNGYFVGGQQQECYRRQCQNSIVVGRFDSDGTPLWEVRYESPDNSYLQSFDMAVGPTGDLYLTTEHDRTTVLRKYAPDQELLWERTYSPTERRFSRASGIGIDAAGHIYLAGQRSEEEGYSTVVLKYDSDGEPVWQRQLGETRNSARDLHLAVSPNGSGYVAGLLDYDPESLEGEGGGAMPFYAPSRFLVHRFDEDGEELWQEQSSGDGLVYFIKALQVDSDESLVLSGSCDSCADDFYSNDDEPCEKGIITIKYGKEGGGQKWRRTEETPPDGTVSAGGLVVDSEKNIYASGVVTECIPNDCESRLLAIKYDSEGSKLWLQKTVNAEEPRSYEAPFLAGHPDGGVVLSGYLAGDFQTVHYNPAGETAWQIALDSPVERRDHATAIKRDAAGNLYLTAQSSDGEGSEHSLLKYDPQGKQVWAKPAAGRLQGLQADRDGNTYVIEQESGQSAVVRYRQDGEELWRKTYDYGDARLLIDAAGHAYLTATEQFCDNDVCERAIVTTKLTASGEELWTSRYDLLNDTNASSTYAEIDSDGNVILATRLQGCGLGCAYAILVLQYSADGELQWETQLWTSLDSLSVEDVAVDSAGSVYVGGSLRDGRSQTLLLKFDPQGNMLWNYRWQPEGSDDRSSLRLFHIAFDTADNPHVVATRRQCSNQCTTAIVTSKYDPDGQLLWSGSTRGVHDSNTSIPAVFVNQSDELTIVEQLNSCSEEQCGPEVRLHEYDAHGREIGLVRHEGLSASAAWLDDDVYFFAGHYGDDLALLEDNRYDLSPESVTEIQLAGPRIRMLGREEAATHRWELGGTTVEGASVVHTLAPGRSQISLTTLSAPGEWVKHWRFESPCPLEDLGPWVGEDIGAVSLPGGALLEQGEDGVTLEICTSGSNLQSNFFFVHQEVSGNTALVCRIDSLSRPQRNGRELKGSRIGLMLRSGLEPEAPFVCLFLEDQSDPRLRAYSRETVSVKRTTIDFFPHEGWIRLERAGDDFVGSTSSDGLVWKEAYRVNMQAPEQLYGGIAANGKNASQSDSLYQMLNVKIDHLAILEAEQLRPSFVRGDCNNDGAVSGTISDVAFLLTYTFFGGPAPACLAACDANGNGTVLGTTEDAIYLLNFSFLGGPPPSAPYPHCGATTPLDTFTSCEGSTLSCQ